MKFEPKTKEEMSLLLADGECDFKVVESSDGVTGNGHPKLVLKLSVADKNGKIATLVDHLAALWRVRNFAYSSGLEDQYENGDIAAKDCVGREGRCIVKTEQGRIFEGKEMPPRNVIANYIETKEVITEKSKTTTVSINDDDINF